MHFKLIIALVEDDNSDTVLEAARTAGATGATVINSARGEGVEKQKTFFGLTLTTQRDVLLFLVEEHMSRRILETIRDVGQFNVEKGAGIAFQLDVEDVVGIQHQAEMLKETLEDEI